ncbi:MAG: hypothetical protein KJ061_20795, partial [Vicinamibacteraceae bacterium]|nr:hypothetical protein [Vicinamibacteraceae bacterium]
MKPADTRALTVAVATSLVELPPGDLALLSALRRRGADAAPVVWSSPHVDWRGFDLVLIRSCWDYHLRLHEFLAWVEALEAAAVPVLNAP